MTPTLFIDRDGTLIEEPADEQVDRLDKVRLVAGVVPALLSLKAAGFRFVMVTNQDGLGTPSFPEPAFRSVHEFVLGLFASQGIGFAAVLICPHRASDGCDCRKPGTGMLKLAAREHAIDLSRSFVVGDRYGDIELARNAGAKSILVQTGYGAGELEWHAAKWTVQPDHVAETLTEATEWILRQPR